MFSSSGDANSLVIDHGTSMTRTSFAGECIPQSIYPSVVGYSLGTKPSCYVGSEVSTNKQNITFHKVFSKGKVVNYEHYEKLLFHNFYNELCVAPEEHPVMIAETSCTENAQREKITQIMFESFCIPAFYIENDNLLSLYAYGKTTGTVLGIGEEQACCTPIYENQVLSHAVTFGSVAGTQIDEYLYHLVKDDFGMNHNNRMDIYRDIKEKKCKIFIDYENQVNMGNFLTYDLPDGKKINISDASKIIMAPELLFKPELFNIQDSGIDQIIASSITKSYSFLEKSLLGDILLTGGSTMFNGLADKLHYNLSNNFSFNKKIMIRSPLERKYSVWIGLSILASLSRFEKIWMNKEEYEEYGTKYIEVKCPSTYSIFQKNVKKSFTLNFKEILNNFPKNSNLSIHFI